MNSLTESHTGKYLAPHLVEVLMEFGIETKVSSLLVALSTPVV